MCNQVKASRIGKSVGYEAVLCRMEKSGKAIIVKYIYIYSEILPYVFFVSISDIVSVSFILSLYIQEVPGEMFHNLAIILTNSEMW